MKLWVANIVNFGQSLGNDEKRRLKHFSISAVVFFCAYGMIHWLNSNASPSLEQELWAIVFFIVGALSFIYAIVLQLIYIANRILK